MTTEKPADTQTPPWGNDFDAEKAWTLIQNLRAEKAQLQTNVTTERQAREAAEKALADADVEGKVSAAEKRAQDAERGLSREKALRKFPVLDGLEGLEEFLTGDTEEQILAKAERLASLGGGKKTGTEPEPKEPAGNADAPKEPEIPGKPIPSLTPGHGGSDATPFDPEAIAKQARVR